MADATKETLLTALPELVEVARKHADESERQRNLAPAVAEAFLSAGVFRICRPKALGGLELDPLSLIDVLETLGTGDGSAAWCAMVSGGGGFLEAFVPLEGAREMFTSPHAVSAGVLAPLGKIEEVDSGYRLSGRWSMASNCRQSQWLLAGAILHEGGAPKKSPSGGPQACAAYVPVSDCRILDTWHVSGLCGTGSHDFEVSDVFVPGRRCFRFPLEAAVASSLNPFAGMGFLATEIAAVALGVTRTALDEFVRIARPDVPGKPALAQRAYAQAAYAEAEASWRSARAYLHDAVGTLWNQVREGKKAPMEETARLRMACCHVTRACAESVDILYTNGGSRSLYANSLLQRCFRDVHAMTQHAFVARPLLETVGRVLLGAGGEPPVL